MAGSGGLSVAYSCEQSSLIEIQCQGLGMNLKLRFAQICLDFRLLHFAIMAHDLLLRLNRSNQKSSERLLALVQYEIL